VPPGCAVASEDGNTRVLSVQELGVGSKKSWLRNSRIKSPGAEADDTRRIQHQYE
jgi:hypothetical protein